MRRQLLPPLSHSAPGAPGQEELTQTDLEIWRNDHLYDLKVKGNNYRKK